MSKYLFMLVTTLLLSACSNQHEELNTNQYEWLELKLVTCPETKSGLLEHYFEDGRITYAERDILWAKCDSEYHQSIKDRLRR